MYSNKLGHGYKGNFDVVFNEKVQKIQVAAWLLGGKKFQNFQNLLKSLKK